MSTIYEVYAREILDSRGNPTVEVEVVLESGIIGRAIAPSRPSTGGPETLRWADAEKSGVLGKYAPAAIDFVDYAIMAPKLECPRNAQALIENIMIDLDPAVNKSTLEEKGGTNKFVSGLHLGGRVFCDNSSPPKWAKYGRTLSVTGIGLPRILGVAVKPSGSTEKELDIGGFLFRPLRPVEESPLHDSFSSGPACQTPYCSSNNAVILVKGSIDCSAGRESELAKKKAVRRDDDGGGSVPPRMVFTSLVWLVLFFTVVCLALSLFQNPAQQDRFFSTLITILNMLVGAIMGLIYHKALSSKNDTLL